MYNHYLKTFICVAEAGSFLKASEQLCISTSALIKQINLFENYLGLKLLERSNRGVTLTEEGYVIYTEGKQLIQRSDDLLQKLKKQQKKEIIRFGSSHLHPIKRLTASALWEDIKARCSDIEIDIVDFSDSDGYYLDAKSSIWDQIDIYCAGLGKTQVQEGLIQLPIGMTMLSCALPDGHSLARFSSISLEDLHGKKLAIVYQGLSDSIDNFRAEVKEKHPEIQIIDVPPYSMDTFNRCVKEGIALLSLNEWQNIHPFMKNVPFIHPYNNPYGLIYPQNSKPAVKKFVNTVEKSMEQNGFV